MGLIVLPDRSAARQRERANEDAIARDGPLGGKPQAIYTCCCFLHEGDEASRVFAEDAEPVHPPVCPSCMYKLAAAAKDGTLAAKVAAHRAAGIMTPGIAGVVRGGVATPRTFVTRFGKPLIVSRNKKKHKH